MKKKHMNLLLLGGAVAAGYYLLKGRKGAASAPSNGASTGTKTTSTGAKSPVPSSPKVQAGSLGNGTLGSLGGSLF